MRAGGIKVDALNKKVITLSSLYSYLLTKEKEGRGPSPPSLISICFAYQFALNEVF